MLYLFIPMMLFAVAPGLNGGFEILRIILLGSGPLILYLLKPVNFKKFPLYLVTLSGILFMYFFSFIFNNQNYVNFLFGSYRRNFGFIVLLGAYLLFFLALEQPVRSVQKSQTILLSTLVLAIMYGFIQVFGFDFIKTESQESGLTLGNINFASAFIGILTIIPLTLTIMAKSIIKFYYLIVFLLSMILIFSLDSSQGLVYSIVGILILIIKYLKVIQLNVKLKVLYTIISILLPISVFLIYLFKIGFRTINDLYTYINTIFQVSSRIDHWKLAIDIGLDHVWFGVGIDDMFRFSGEYIQESVAARFKGFVLPDKAHNLILDHFVNGGILVASFWLIFCSSIFLICFRLIFTFDTHDNYLEIVVFTSIWTNYFIQTLISTDHIVLFTLGMLSAGTLVNIYRQHENKARY